jgi:hypothetical protein
MPIRKWLCDACDAQLSETERLLFMMSLEADSG